MSSKITDKLLEGYELKNNTPAPEPQPKPAPLAEGESYTISDKPNTFVLGIFDCFHNFEQKNPSIAGKSYIFMTTIILTLLLWVKQAFLTELPAVETIFVAFLVTFIFNYYLINGALYKPFLDSDEHSFLIKLCGAYAVGIVACFFYSLRFVQMQTSLAVFCSSFFLAILFGAISLKEQFKTIEYITALGALAGAILTVAGSSGALWDETATKDSETIYGLLLAGVSAIFMALMMKEFSKMHEENFATLNHIFTMMIVLFVPIFFPIQGVVTPSLIQWALLIVFGLLTSFGTLFFIRSLQLGPGARASVYLSLVPALIFIVEFIVSGASGAIGMVGAVIAIISVGLYSGQAASRVPVHHNLIEKDGKNSVEMTNLHRTNA